MSVLASIFDPFFAFDWRGLYEVLRVIFIILDALFIGGIIFALVKGWEYRPRFNGNPRKVKKKTVVKNSEFAKRWATIIAKAKANPPHSYILSVIEADKFVDDILKQLGFLGETMADRLGKLNGSNMKTLERLWRVHRVRNELVHNPDFNMSRLDANDILKGYYDFLMELDVL